IAEGSVMNPLSSVAGGARASWFLAEADPQLARKRWIAAMKPQGALAIDAGAVTALQSGKSLLPAGVVAVTGSFGRGDPVEITGPAGERLAQGL
ncbi:glutamate 5-kinase, partial [Klebsiella pneumoniae]|nr:glutamate 5-kinase [Klebsiella pneumoniae]